MVNIFRSLIIDWLNFPDNIDFLINLDEKTKSIINNPILFLNKDSNKELIINTYIVKLMENNIESNLGLFELFILKQIHEIQIVFLVNGIHKYVISDAIKEINSKSIDNKYNKSKYITINLDLSEKSQYPNIIETIYWKSNTSDK